MPTFFLNILLMSIFCMPPHAYDEMTCLKNTNDPVPEVIKALDGQVTAWNAGDLEKAMTFYWNSPEIIWVNKSGIQKGYQSVLEDFRKGYTDKTKMGIYSYESLHIEKISDSAVYFVIKWKIMLNGERIMGGISSLLWKKIDANWVITAEHAS